MADAIGTGSTSEAGEGDMKTPLWLIRLMVGAVFVEAAVQKFLFPETQGSGRFLAIGFPAPQFLATFVASFELVCGLAVLCGFRIRTAAIPLIIIMLVALLSTKLPMLSEKGVLAAIHAARLDFSMLLGGLFLFCVGRDRVPVLDALLRRE